MVRVNERTVERIQQEYRRSTNPWFVAYSGGKDSSALLKLTFRALLRIENPCKPVTVVYCNTGMEIPVIRSFALHTLADISVEAQKKSVPMCVRIVTPRLTDRFFVKMIGRGYPPPTNKFRWCTDRLLIRPVQDALQSACDGCGTLLLGTRQSESSSRKKSVSEHETERDYYFRQSGNRNTVIYSPIVDYSTEQVWATLTQNSMPRSVDGNKLLGLYGGKDGERRFGCWTCTVVRRDRATEGLVSDGFAELLPLLGFRNWLMDIRNKPTYRCARRRNGDIGKGPFKLSARRKILERLLGVQRQSGLRLITRAEVEVVKKLWKRDRLSTEYVEK
jgi:DNA sulfur modification protein DndC